MTLRYVTGTARALVRGSTVVVLPGPVDAALVEQVWDQLGSDPGVVEVLQVLTGAFGSSLRTIPPFAVAVVAGRRVHVAVRGALAVTLELDDGERVHADGEDVTTWSERVVDDVVELLVRTGVDPADARRGESLLGAATSLPLASGVVLADAVAWQLAERPVPPEEEPLEEPGLGLLAEAARPGAVSVLEGVPVTFAPVSEPTTEPEPVGALGATIRMSEETIAPEPEATVDAVAPEPGPAQPATDVAGVPADEPDDVYAHLWGSTVLRTVEDAAVRAEEAEPEDDVPVPSHAPVPAPPTPEEPAGEAHDAQPVPLPGDALIAGVPREWTGATPAAAHRAATVLDPEDEQADDAATGVEPTADGGEGLDHDGHTVHSSAIADLRAAAQSAGPPAPAPRFTAPPAPGQQQILARTCEQGHANPPSRDTCALCGGELDRDAELAVRPPLGRIVVSTGQTVELDRPVVVGRRPRTPRAQAADLPRLVTVPSPQQDISRSHLEITLEGWHVLVSDMATTNGTTLLRSGQPPRRLHPSEPVLVVDGDVADLGDGVTLVFEGIR